MDVESTSRTFYVFFFLRVNVTYVTKGEKNVLFFCKKKIQGAIIYSPP